MASLTPVTGSTTITTPIHAPRRRRSFIIFTLLTIAVAQELCFRFIFPLPEVRGFNRIDYSRLDFSNPSFAAARKRGLSNTIIRWQSSPDGLARDHTLNLYGFRGDDFNIDPPVSKARVLFIGDSFVEGCGATDEETIPRQFGFIAGRGQALESINLGVTGADCPQYIDLARDAIPLLRPTGVFLVLFANDLPAPSLTPATNPRSFPRMNPLVPRAAELIRRWSAGEGIPRRWADGPSPYFQIQEPSARNRPAIRLPPPNVDPAIREAMAVGSANPGSAASLAWYEKQLKCDFSSGGSPEDYLWEIDGLCKSVNGRLFVVYIPYCATTNSVYLASQAKLGGWNTSRLPDLTSSKYRAHQEHLVAVCHKLDLPFVDTTEAFCEAERNDRMYWPIDGHCNAAGYRLVATRCADAWLAH